MRSIVEIDKSIAAFTTNGVLLLTALRGLENKVLEAITSTVQCPKDCRI